MLRKTLIITALTLFAVTAEAAPFGNPSIASLKIYGMAISPNKDCSAATVVGYNAAGTDYDFKQSPTLFSGNIPAGTYECVVLYMSTLLTFTPATTVGTCVAGTSYTRNVANGGGDAYTPGTPDANSVLVYGTTAHTGASNGQDIAHAGKVLLFLSTGSVGDGSSGGAFLQPTTVGSTNGIKLGAPFVVSSSAGAGTFVVNFDGALNGGMTPCDLGPPTFTFR